MSFENNESGDLHHIRTSNSCKSEVEDQGLESTDFTDTSCVDL